MLTLLRSRLSGVTLNGDHPKFLHPDVEPYRYLGVELTMTLNWKFQMQAATQILQDKGKLVNSSMLAPLQKLTFIQLLVFFNVSRRPARIKFNPNYCQTYVYI